MSNKNKVLQKFLMSSYNSIYERICYYIWIVSFISTNWLDYYWMFFYKMDCYNILLFLHFSVVSKPWYLAGVTAVLLQWHLSKMNQVNPLRPRRNGCHFADNTLNRIFLNENVRIPITISLKFSPKGPIPALVHIMALHRPGDKPLSEPMMVSLLTHIYLLT